MKKLILILSATTLATGIVAVHLWQQLRSEREHSGQLRAQVADLQSQRGVVAGVAQASAQPGTPQPAAPGSAPASGEASGPAANANPRGRMARALMGEIGDMLQDPESRDLLRQQLRGALPQMYPDLARELGLSPEELDKLFDVLARQQLEEAANLLGRNEGGDAADPAARQERQRAALERQRANETELTALLGGKYPQWEEYQGSQQARQQVTRLRSTLATAGQPLSDAQAKPLIAALAAEQRRTTQDASQMLAGAASTDEMLALGVRSSADGNRRLREIAAVHLTPQQLEAYSAMLEREERMARRFMGAMQGGAPPAAPGP